MDSGSGISGFPRVSGAHPNDIELFHRQVSLCIDDLFGFEMFDKNRSIAW
jgi:hypothetical protein